MSESSLEKARAAAAQIIKGMEIGISHTCWQDFKEKHEKLVSKIAPILAAYAGSAVALERRFVLVGRGREEKMAKDWMSNLTWKCDICHRERPDVQISVHKVDIGPPSHPGVVIRNVRYCNDTPACREGAENWKLRMGNNDIEL